MIKVNKLKNKSRKIVKKYGKNNKNLRHKNTFKNIKNVGNMVDVKSQKGGEVNALSDFDYSQFNVSKYINAQIDWGSSPGQAPTPNCTLL